MNKISKCFFWQALVILIGFFIYTSNFSGEDNNTIILITLIYGIIIICYTIFNIILTFCSSLLTKNLFIPFIVTPILLLFFGLIFHATVFDALSFKGNNKYIIFAISLSANLITYYLVKNKLKLNTNE